MAKITKASLSGVVIKPLDRLDLEESSEIQITIDDNLNLPDDERATRFNLYQAGCDMGLIQSDQRRELP